MEDRRGKLLSRDDIDVYLDGQPMRFSYGRARGRLTCPNQGLSSGPHTVEIEAHIKGDDEGGRGGKRWTFNVKK